MKYKVGDKVRIKSLDWYNEHALIDISGVFRTSIESLCLNKKRFMGKELTICSVLSNGHYLMEETGVLRWTDEMIEGLVEEEIKLKFKVGDKITNGKENLIIRYIAFDKYIVEDNSGEYDTLYFDTQNDWKLLAEGFSDSIIINQPKYNKLYINTELCDNKVELIISSDFELKQEGDKWFAIKKKKEYPKTYEECCKVLGVSSLFSFVNMLDKEVDLYGAFICLIRCRDAYWKIAGEEMGLWKPWKPDWKNSEERRYSIVNIEGDINLPEITLTKWVLKVTNKILVFPTIEMRDTFYKNFKELIESVKELL